MRELTTGISNRKTCDSCLTTMHNTLKRLEIPYVGNYGTTKKLSICGICIKKYSKQIRITKEQLKHRIIQEI